MKVVGLDHLVLTVASIERSVAFYTGVLGMTHEVFGRERRSALRFGALKINLHEAGREFEPKAEAPTAGAGDLCLLVDDIAGVRAALAARQVAILGGPVRRTGARGPITSYYVRDPDGNLIELSAYDREEAAGARPAAGCELLTTEEMGRADRRAVALGVRSLTLMENAGRAVAAVAREMVGPDGRIVVLAGPGNNGGDGFVAARLLAAEGYDVSVLLLGARDRLAGDARLMAERWTGPLDPPEAARLDGAGLIIDALFGAGLARPLDGAAKALVEAANASRAPILAVDVPSGLDGNTGASVGAVIAATRTVTFFRRKPGHVLMPGRELCGPVTVADIAIPEAVLADIAPSARANAPAAWRSCYPWPRAGGHKYDRGHAVVVSGGIEMSGAARLAARAALRAGAGLVTVAAPPDAVVAHAAQLNAVMVRRLDGAEGLRRLLADRRLNAIAIGPGLGRDDGALDRVLMALTAGAAVVLDADALAVAAEVPAAVFRSIGSDPARAVVLTPHEGEFRRLFPALAGSKLERARRAAELSGAVVVLKGPDTVIAGPDGQALINENAPAWLATAGAGDVLAGLAAGLLAQRMPAFEAAAAAVWLHGEAALLRGPGLIAEDITEQLPSVLRGLQAATVQSR